MCVLRITKYANTRCDLTAGFLSVTAGSILTVNYKVKNQLCAFLAPC